MADDIKRNAKEFQKGAPIGDYAEPIRRAGPNDDGATRSYGALRGSDAPSSSGVYTKEVAPRFNKGGMVKAGSPKVTAPCADTKTIKCY